MKYPTHINVNNIVFSMENKEEKNFATKIGFILASAGSAIGLGNLWRFPYLAEQNGGGIFLLVYIILVVTFGFTLLITELTIGRRTGKSCISAFGSVSEKHRWIGYLAILPPLIILPYYVVIGGWVLKYLFEYATGGGMAVASSGYFNDFIGCSMDSILDGPFIWFLIFGFLVLFFVARGIQSGIEKLSKVLMPILLILLIGLTVYTLAQPNGIDAAVDFLTPDFSKFSAATVLDATGQLFYSMSLAMGIMITFGSYMKKDVPIEKSTRQISIMDTSVAILAGLLIVPAVAIFSSAEISSGPGLMFMTLPAVFQSMPGGDIVGLAFFVLVLFAALTSAMSLAETLVYPLMEKIKVKRLTAVAIVAAIVLVLGSLSCFGYGPLSGFTILGLQMLDFFDFISNSVVMPIVAILTCLFVGFVVGTKFISDEIESSGPFKTKKFYGFMVKWVAPILLVAILVMGISSTFGIQLF